MTSDQDIVRDGRIDEYFEIGDLLLSTGTADGYLSTIRGENDRVILWCTRTSMLGKQDEIQDFLFKIKSLAQFSSLIPKIEASGVEATGTGFIAIPRLDGQELTDSASDKSEVERRVTACISIINRFHDAGIFFGNLTNSSFWVGRNGEITFTGLAAGILDSSKLPLEVKPFIAPEHNQDLIPTPVQDIYSLGVLIYYLFTGSYPFGRADDYLANIQRTEVIPPNSIGSEISPDWLTEVVSQCCAISPSERFQSIEELLKKISEGRAKEYADKSAPVSNVASLALANQVQDGMSLHSRKPKKSKSAIITGYRALLNASFAVKSVFLFIILTALSFWVIQRTMLAQRVNSDELKNELSPYREAALNEDLKIAVDVLAEPSTDLSSKKLEFLKLIESEDPLSHSILTEIAIHAPTKVEQGLAEKAIVERLRNKGFNKSSVQISAWLSKLGSKADMVAYAALLKAVDPVAPVDARISSLKSSYQTYPKSTLLTAAGLAFDLEEGLDKVRPILATLAKDAYGIADADKYSSLAIMLATPELALIYSDEILKSETSITDKDLLWAQQYVIERNPSLAQTLSGIILKREFLSPIRSEFLKILLNRGAAAYAVGPSLIRAAAGNISEQDVINLGSWYDKDAEKTLFLLCADPQTEAAIKTRSLDVLAGRSLTSEPGISLIDWLRNNNWEQRQDYAHAVGVLATINSATQADINQAFKDLDKAVRNTDLVQVLIDSEEPKILENLIKYHKDLLGLGILLNLLDHPNKNVRINAVKGLAQYNDLGALKLIIDHYHKEIDTEVQKVYKDTFWVIRKREGENVQPQDQ
ncbi:MAG: hypothetical protein R3A13_06765 [Bdellovibrionota bacterium]